MSLVFLLLIYLVLAIIASQIIEESGNKDLALKVGRSAVWAWRVMTVSMMFALIAWAAG
jgi:hypothetical protein